MTDAADHERLNLADPQQRPRFTGLATFFRAPVAESAAGLDIALVGVPYDGGVTNRPGTRHGPREVRNQSSLMRRINQATGAAPFASARVADIGDAWVAKPFELSGAHAEIEAFFAQVKASGARALACGGDHSMSLPILRALAGDAPLGMIHIDAHADTGDNYGGSRFHHGAPFKIAVDEGLLDPTRVAQIGIRGSMFDPDMWRFSHESGMKVTYVEELEARGWRTCMEEALAFVGDGPIYVSFDIDALDPAFAPGTGTPEAGGLTMREAMGMVRMLKGCDIRGADVVEVSPPFDHAGLTAMNGATIMFELLCVMAGGAAVPTGHPDAPTRG